MMTNVMQIEAMADRNGFEVPGGATSAGFTINGVNVGAVGGSLATLITGINAFTGQTGVTASADATNTYLVLSSDERGINLTSTNAANAGTDSKALGMTVGLSSNSIGGSTAPGVAGTSAGLTINGINVGVVGNAGILADYIADINAFTSQTGVTASADATNTSLVLTSSDGRLNITNAVVTDAATDAIALGFPAAGSLVPTGTTIANQDTRLTNQNYGRLTLVEIWS